MYAQTLPCKSRFTRRTSLQAGEYNKNFQMLDDAILDAVTSPEADAITLLMSKIYLRLRRTPCELHERPGVLRFCGENTKAGRLTAWKQLCRHLCVSSAVAHKALAWMHEQGIIGYSAHKNGVGIRIFLNRATDSIGTRTATTVEKNLSSPPASFHEPRASRNEAAFNDTFGVIDVSDKKCISRAPKNSADNSATTKHDPDGEHPIQPSPHTPSHDSPSDSTKSAGGSPHVERERDQLATEALIAKLRHELEPLMRQAAMQVAAREHERTREWLEKYGLPKAARVAQRETYNVLRSNRHRGEASITHTSASVQNASAHAATEASPPANRLREYAEICCSMRLVHNCRIETTLAAICQEPGAELTPEDVARVRDMVEAMCGAESASSSTDAALDGASDGARDLGERTRSVRVETLRPGEQGGEKLRWHEIGNCSEAFINLAWQSQIP